MTHEEAEFAQWEPTVRYWAARFRVTDEDMIQEARVALLLAIRNYDPARGTKSTHYHNAVKYAFKERLRQLERQKRLIICPLTRDTSTVHDDDEDGGEMAPSVPPKDEQVLLADLVDRLPERERRIVKMYASGKTEREIGAVEGVSNSRIGQILAQARARMRSWL